MPRVTDIEIVEDRTARSRCDEGFLRLKRYRARNRRADGSTSAEYPIDVIDRPSFDAVAVCLYARGPAGWEVLTRAGLRPAALFRRGRPVCLPEREYLLLEELVAGVVEPELRQRALQRGRVEGPDRLVVGVDGVDVELDEVPDELGDLALVHDSALPWRPRKSGAPRAAPPPRDSSLRAGPRRAYLAACPA